MSDNDNIQSVLGETRVFPPPAEFVAKARVNAAGMAELRAAADKDYVGFWAGLAKQELSWKTPFTVTLDDSKAPNYAWFTDGKINVSYNCIDRHLDKRGDKAAIRFESEPGAVTTLSFKQLHAEVCRLANVL